MPDFSDVRVEEIAGVMRFDSFDDYWRLQTAVAGPVALLVASLSADDVDTIRAGLEGALGPFKSGSGYRIPSHAVAVSAN